MAPRTRRNPQLQRRISRLRLNLQHQQSTTTRKAQTLQAHIDRLNAKLLPLYPQPHGSPHPRFPKTILHWLLLTEDELDEIAHHYSQSTPDAYTNDYPAPMGWDTEFLARGDTTTPQLMPWDEAWLAQSGCLKRESAVSHLDLAASCSASTPTPTAAPVPSQQLRTPRAKIASADHQEQELPCSVRETASPSTYDHPSKLPITPPPMSTAERIAIKRRKLGKFIGLQGCETPTLEMQRRVRFLEARLERAVRLAASSDAGSGRQRWHGGGSPGRPRIGKDLL